MKMKNDNQTTREEKVVYEFEICEELKYEIFELTQEESQVIVHFKIHATEEDDAARIWKSTFLIDVNSGVKYPMVHWEGITVAPEWTKIPKKKPLDFMLVFKGLPKKCKSFHLIEMIPEPGGFELRNIQRNSQDVYQVEM